MPEAEFSLFPAFEAIPAKTTEAENVYLLSVLQPNGYVSAETPCYGAAKAEKIPANKGEPAASKERHG